MLDGGTGFLKAGYAGQVRRLRYTSIYRSIHTEMSPLYRTSPSNSTRPSSVVQSSVPKSRLVWTFSSRTSCAVTRQPPPDQCCRLPIPYDTSNKIAGYTPKLTRLHIDGERYRQALGRHATSLGLHLLREDEGRPHRP